MIYTWSYIDAFGALLFTLVFYAQVVAVYSDIIYMCRRSATFARKQKLNYAFSKNIYLLNGGGGGGGER